VGNKNQYLVWLNQVKSGGDIKVKLNKWTNLDNSFLLIGIKKTLWQKILA